MNALQERVAELLGQEAALFLPSGTMCNAIAFRLHVRPGGDEVILDRTSHPVYVRGGRPGGAVGSDAQRPRRRRRHLHRCSGRGCGAPGRRPLRPSLAAGVGRADDQHRRRPGLAAGRGAGGAGRRAPARDAHAPGRGPAHERGRRRAASRRPTTRAASTRPGSISRRGSARPWAPCSRRRKS